MLAAGQVGQGPAEYDLSAAEHGRLVAEPAHVGQVVRDEHRRLALLLAAQNHFVEQLAGRKVHAFGRLVQHQQLRVVDQGLSEGQPLQHALAEGGDRLARAVGQADFVQQPRDPLGQFPPAEQRKAAVVIEERAGGQVARKGRAFMHVADAGQRAAVATCRGPAAGPCRKSAGRSTAAT